jgi:hypothetical protein
LKRLTLAAAFGVALSAAPAHAADLDPYACFGGARYVAMGAGFQCADLPAFCAGARVLLAEAGGNEAAAEKLARSRAIAGCRSRSRIVSVNREGLMRSYVIDAVLALVGLWFVAIRARMLSCGNARFLVPVPQ